MSTAFSPEKAIRGPIRAALTGRCPRCARGRLFRGYLTVANTCDVCGLDYGGHDAADGPAVLIILFLGFVIAGMVAWLELVYQPPVWVHMVVWTPVIFVLSMACLRPLKGAFIGIQYRYRSVDREFPGDWE